MSYSKYLRFASVKSVMVKVISIEISFLNKYHGEKIEKSSKIRLNVYIKKGRGCCKEGNLP